MPDMAMIGLVEKDGAMVLDSVAMGQCEEYLRKIHGAGKRDRLVQCWATHMYFFFMVNMLFQGTADLVLRYVMCVCEATFVFAPQQQVSPVSHVCPRRYPLATSTQAVPINGRAGTADTSR